MACISRLGHLVLSALAIARRLRHMGQELRELRPLLQGDEALWRKELIKASGMLGGEGAELVERCLLPQSILDAIDSDPDRHGNLYKYSLLQIILGYIDFDVFDREGVKVEEHGYLFLRPGLVSCEWPEIFEPILGEYVESSHEAKNQASTLFIEHRYQIIGYYAKACELLAEWIEKNNRDVYTGRATWLPESLSPRHYN